MMKYMLKSGIGALALLALVSCGSDNQPASLTDELVGTLRGALAQRQSLRKGQVVVQAADQVTRAQADESTFPLIRITSGNTGVKATAGALERNGDTLTYLMASDAGVYMRGGMMTGTRGTGSDLMSLALPHRSVAAIVKAGQHQRVHRYLNAENRLFKVAFTCSTTLGGAKTLTQLGRSYRVRTAVESCQGTMQDKAVSFQNTYDMDARGQVWKSRQWISPASGYVVIEQLKP